MAYATFNPVAIFVAAVVAFGLGYLWYVPLFGGTWPRLSGQAGKSAAELEALQAGAARAYAITFAAQIVMAAALTVLADYFALFTAVQALKLAALVFFGFVGPVGLIATAHAGRPWMAWGIDAGYQLLYLVLMSLIIVLWL